MKLSIVSTMYCSAQHLREFHARCSVTASRITDDFEIVLVNDGSPDESLEVALELWKTDRHLRVVDLSKNFGHHKAMMTGLEHARGDLVFLLDCDLEEPPEALAAFLNELERTGSDVIYGVQERRRGALFDRMSAWLYYTVYNLLSPEPIPRDVMTIRLMTHRYVTSLLAHREREMHIAGLWAATGYRQTPLTLAKGSKGSTTYTIARRLGVLVSAVTSFSNAPLVWIFYLGAFILMLSAAAAAYLVVRILFFGALLAGWASLVISIWLLGGLTVFSVGLIGIYLSKIFLETKQRPYTIVRQLYEHPAVEPR
jgi:putative glycosyltransferase